MPRIFVTDQIAGNGVEVLRKEADVEVVAEAVAGGAAGDQASVEWAVCYGRFT